MKERIFHVRNIKATICSLVLSEVGLRLLGEAKESDFGLNVELLMKVGERKASFDFNHYGDISDLINEIHNFFDSNYNLMAYNLGVNSAFEDIEFSYVSIFVEPLNMFDILKDAQPFEYESELPFH